MKGFIVTIKYQFKQKNVKSEKLRRNGVLTNVSFPKGINIFL